MVEGVNTDYRSELHQKASLSREGDHEVVEGVDTASLRMTDLAFYFEFPILTS